jgi:hypothetical protein
MKKILAGVFVLLLFACAMSAQRSRSSAPVAAKDLVIKLGPTVKAPAVTLLMHFFTSFAKGDFEHALPDVAQIFMQGRDYFQTLPGPLAEKKNNDLIARQKEIFQSGKAPLILGSVTLQTLLAPASQIEILEIKLHVNTVADTAPGGINYDNVFVKVDYGQTGAPVIRDFGVKPVKSFYLVVGMYESRVFVQGVTTGYDPWPRIQILKGSEEFWD